MLISLSLLLLFIGSTSAKKTGDFGSLTACKTKTNDLRLDCYYANCTNSPPFECEFMDAYGSRLTNKSQMCNHTIKNHTEEHKAGVTHYSCILTRKGRTQKLEISINYNLRGKKSIKPCRDTTGLLLRPTVALLWPVVILCLWRVLITDSQMT